MKYTVVVAGQGNGNVACYPACEICVSVQEVRFMPRYKERVEFCHGGDSVTLAISQDDN